MGTMERENIGLIQGGPLLPPVPCPPYPRSATNRLSGVMSDEPEIIEI